MFDSSLKETRDTALDRVRCFFFDHGHRLAEAASLLGGSAAERRVVSLSLRLETAKRIDRQIYQGLIALHSLLTLQDVGNPGRVESGYFSTLHPASREVEQLCLLADLFTDLLAGIGIDAQRDRQAPGLRSLVA